MYKIVIHVDEKETHLFSSSVSKDAIIKELKEIISRTSIEGVVSPKYKENHLKSAFVYASEAMIAYFEEVKENNKESVLDIDFKFLNDDVNRSATRYEFVTRYTYSLISLWLTCLCERGFLSKENYEKSLRTFPTSILVQKNIDLLQHPVTKVILFGATADSLNSGLENTCDSRAKNLFSKFLESMVISNKQGRKEISKNYKPNSFYTFKASILKFGMKEGLEYKNILEVCDALTVFSGTAYQQNPTRRILAGEGYITIDGKVASEAALKHYYYRVHGKNSDAKAIRNTIREGSRIRGLTKTLSVSSIKIDGEELNGSTEISDRDGNLIQAYGVFDRSILFRKKKKF